ncbi:MAG: hypothetical protein RL148_2395 [Planctomycetota bacterium]|jgi:hypothetical protein
MRTTLERRLRALVEEFSRDFNTVDRPGAEADLDDLLQSIRDFASRAVEPCALPEVPGGGAIAGLMAPRNCSFSGRTDFVSIEDVLQMLAAGKHSGCLTIETEDDRVDVWLHDGRIAFLDPFRIERRQVPGSDPAVATQLSAEELESARRERPSHGQPLLLHLHARKVLRCEDLVDMLAVCGKDALFAMMRAAGSRSFSFHSVELPLHAVQFDLCLGVTSALLEGSRLADDWKQLQRVFPDPSKPVRRLLGAETLVADETVAPSTVRVAMELDGTKGAAQVAAAVGLPLFDTCVELVRLARKGVVEPQGGTEALASVEVDLEVVEQPALPPFAARPCLTLDEEAPGPTATEEPAGPAAVPVEAAAPLGWFSRLVQRVRGWLRPGSR